MSDAPPQVYFSYKWGGDGERIVNAIDAVLSEEGIPFVRDKKDLGYKGGIAEFMQEIGRGSCVVVVICDKYLKSPNTMYELVEMSKNLDVRDRIFPVVLADADIYDPTHRLKYVKYWEDKKKELGDAMRSVDLANLQGITDDLNNYDSIRDHISRMTSLLKDMNTLTADMHRESNFSQLVNGLRERLADIDQSADEDNADADDNAQADGSEGDFEWTETGSRLGNDLQAGYDDDAITGYTVFIEIDDEEIDLAQINLFDDSAICLLENRENLPTPVRPKAQDWRSVLTDYDFNAPDDNYDRVWFDTGSPEPDDLNNFAHRLVEVFWKVHGIGQDDLQWRPLEE